MAKDRAVKDVTFKQERKFSIRDIHTHVSMFLKKFWEGKRQPKTKFYEKRNR